MTSLAISALTTSGSSSSQSEHVKAKSSTSKVAEPIFSKFNHTHSRRRRRKVVAEEAVSVDHPPQSKLDRSIAKLSLVERCMFAIVRKEPLDQLAVEAARYKDDRPKINPEHLSVAIHAFSVEGMLLLRNFQWTGWYNISEIIYTNLCSDIAKAYTRSREDVVVVNPEALFRINQYALFIARLYKECKWDLSSFHKFYLTHIKTDSDYGQPTICLRNGWCGEGRMLKRLDRAILATVQESLELTPEMMLASLNTDELNLAEKFPDLSRFGITKEHFKAAREALKKTKVPL